MWNRQSIATPKPANRIALLVVAAISAMFAGAARGGEAAAQAASHHIKCGGPNGVVWTSIKLDERAQGDAHLLCGNNRVILIDAGNPWDGELILGSIPNGRVDHVVITHAHSDHYGGLIYLLRRNVPIGEIYFDPPEEAVCRGESHGCNWSEIQEIVERAGERRRAMKELNSLEFDGSARLEKVAHFRYEELSTLGSPVGTNLNNTSPILRLQFGATGTYQNDTALFTGDADGGLLLWLVNNGYRDRLKVTRLKVQHHGADHDWSDRYFFWVTGADYFNVPAPALPWFTDPRFESCRQFLTSLPYPLSSRVYINGHEKADVVFP